MVDRSLTSQEIDLANPPAIYTIHMSPDYRDLAKALLATSVILLTLHILLSGQRSTGLIGSVFNVPFSETLTKVIVAIAFYYLVVHRLVRIV